MRRINALESGISGGSGYAFDYTYPPSFPSPPFITSAERIAVSRAADEFHIGKQDNGSNTDAVDVFDFSGTYIRSYAPYGGDVKGFVVSPRMDTSSRTHLATVTSVSGDPYYVTVWNAAGSLVGTYSSPASASISYLADNGSDYFAAVAASGSASIRKMNSSFSTVATFGTSGIGYGKIRSPRAGAVLSDGDLYVFDTTNKKIIRYTTAGAFVDEYALSYSVSSGLFVEGQFDSQERLHVGGGGDTLSVSYCFDKTGNLLFTYQSDSDDWGLDQYDSSHQWTGSIVNVYAEQSGTYSQTAFSLYTNRGAAVSLGTPDAGVSVPTPYALSDYPAWLHPQHIVDMRTAIQAMASYFDNPTTGNPYNFTDGSADNLYRVAMGDRKAYGGSLGPRYTWTRTGLEMLGTPTYDIDIGEIHECVRQLEAS